MKYIISFLLIILSFININRLNSADTPEFNADVIQVCEEVKAILDEGQNTVGHVLMRKASLLKREILRYAAYKKYQNVKDFFNRAQLELQRTRSGEDLRLSLAGRPGSARSGYDRYII